MRILSLSILLASAGAFHVPARKYRASTVVEGATGGWGIGNSREITPEEFAKGDRRAFEGYRLTDSGDFMRQLKSDKDRMKIDEMDELLGVAKMAGINVKNPEERLNKFDADLLEDEDDLDLSV